MSLLNVQFISAAATQLKLVPRTREQLEADLVSLHKYMEKKYPEPDIGWARIREQEILASLFVLDSPNILTGPDSWFKRGIK